MRLDKFVATNSGLSRKDATGHIKAGSVCLDSIICTNPAAHIKPSQLVSLNGTPLQTATPIYWMLNKPQGVVCANSDAEHPTVFDLIDLNTVHPSLRNHLQIAGRLDIDTTGLVLITSDGEWNHAITSPNKVLGKRYRVTTLNPITPDTPDFFAKGVLLKQETKPTKPANLTLIDSHNALLEITEGKYHQVKRMFAAIGNKVIALHREAIGAITLDAALAPSQYRPLNLNERSLPNATIKDAPCTTKP